MKKNSYVVIISRGGIINEHDLSVAVESKHLAGAAIDATETEPFQRFSFMGFR